MRETKKVTVGDIAKKANVSKATVSRVLNAKSDLVKGETYQKVMEAAASLGYTAPVPALISSPSKEPVIVLCVPDIQNRFYGRIIQGALSSANSHNCHLLVTESPVEGAALPAFIKLLKDVSADGLIVLNALEAETLTTLNKIVPVIQCSEYNEDADLPFVAINNRKAAKTATEYLINRGKSRIALINGSISFRYARERREGFLEALQEAGLSVPSSWMLHLPEISYELGYSALCQLLSNEVKPDAFFCASDTLAASVLRAARHFHYQIPRDIMVVGFDNTDISSMCTPSITTISQPNRQEGFTACEMLINRMNHPDIEINSIFLETELIVREST